MFGNGSCIVAGAFLVVACVGITAVFAFAGRGLQLGRGVPFMPMMPYRALARALTPALDSGLQFRPGRLAAAPGNPPGHPGAGGPGGGGAHPGAAPPTPGGCPASSGCAGHPGDLTLPALRAAGPGWLGRLPLLRRKVEFHIDVSAASGRKTFLKGKTGIPHWVNP